MSALAVLLWVAWALFMLWAFVNMAALLYFGVLVLRDVAEAQERIQREEARR